MLGLDLDHILPISAKFNTNINELIDILVSLINYEQPGDNDVILTNTRHFEAITKASESISRALGGLDTGLSGDLMSQDIRETLHYLGEITGEITTNEILGNIFVKILYWQIVGNQ